MKRRNFLKAAIAAVTGASQAVKAAGAKKIMVEYEPEMAPEIKDISSEMSMGVYVDRLLVNRRCW